MSHASIQICRHLVQLRVTTKPTFTLQEPREALLYVWGGLTNDKVDSNNQRISQTNLYICEWVYKFVFKCVFLARHINYLLSESNSSTRRQIHLVRRQCFSTYHSNRTSLNFEHCFNLYNSIQTYVCPFSPNE